MFKQGFASVAIIIIVVVFLVAGAGLLLWQQTKLPAPSEVEGPAPEVVATTTVVDTANWKTYRNEKYGFEFEYPPTNKLVSRHELDCGSLEECSLLEAEAETADWVGVIGNFGPDVDRHTNLVFSMQAYAEKGKPELLAEQYREKYKLGADNNSIVLSDIVKIITGGLPAYHFEVGELTPFRRGVEVKDNIFTSKNNSNFFIYYDPTSEIASKIITTIKFIN